MRRRSRRQNLAAWLHVRNSWRIAIVVAVGVVGGLAAALFARLCDAAMEAHAALYHLARWPTLLLLPAGFAMTHMEIAVRGLCPGCGARQTGGRKKRAAVPAA